MSTSLTRSAMRQRKSLESWIVDALTDGEKGGPCTMLSLVHCLGAGEREVYSKAIGPAMVPAEIAETIRGRAEAYSQDLSGTQLFNILAFYNGEKVPAARFPYAVAGDFGLDMNSMNTFSPDARGEKAMGMQYLQAGLAMVFNQTRVIFEAGERAIERSERREARIAQEHADGITLVHKLLLEKVMADHELRMKELQFERASQERKTFMKLAPALVNSATGRDIFPQETIDSAIIEGLVTTLTKNPSVDLTQLLGMMNAPPELVGLVTARMTEVRERQQREALEARNASKGMRDHSNVDDELGLPELEPKH